MTREIDYRRAACRGMDANLFFDQDITNEMLAVCDRCEVQAACIVVNIRERGGVWGCSERARRRVRMALRENPDMTDDEIIELGRRKSSYREPKVFVAGR
jgi:hypothetical protein